MNTDDLRTLIREILSHEIANLRTETGAFADTTPRPQQREEVVAMRNNADLMAFALKILELAKDGKAVSDIKAGRWQFRLENSTARDLPGTAPLVSAASAQFERGLIAERQIVNLKPNTQLKVGKRVRFTPLALDEIRRRNIQIERAKQ